MRTLLIFLVVCSTTVVGQDFENVVFLDNWQNDSLQALAPFGIRYNEVWGFVQNEEEYAVIGSTMGTHFFRLTGEDEIEELAFVPGAFQGEVIHRDYHDYEGYLYAVCDQGASSLQIIDLQYLPDSVSVVYDSDEWVVRAHNVFIDSSSALLFLAGPLPAPLRVLSIENPTEPEFVSELFDISYVHDLFVRNDTAYLNCANQGLLVVDYSDPVNPDLLGSLSTYPDAGYNHSGWLSEDGNTYVLADETPGLRMKVCDVSDLSDVQVLSLFGSDVSDNSVPHNLMIKGDLVYISHYNDGLQVFDISDRENPERIAYYDTFDGDESYAFNGAWGVYCFLPSERILISDRTSGLYLFRLDEITGMASKEQGPEIRVFPNPTRGEVTIENDIEQPQSINLYNFSGQIVAQFAVGQWHAGGVLHFDWSELPTGMYVVEVMGASEVARINLIKF